MGFRENGAWTYFSIYQLIAPSGNTHAPVCTKRSLNLVMSSFLLCSNVSAIPAGCPDARARYEMPKSYFPHSKSRPTAPARGKKQRMRRGAMRGNNNQTQKTGPLTGDTIRHNQGGGPRHLGADPSWPLVELAPVRDLPGNVDGAKSSSIFSLP